MTKKDFIALADYIRDHREHFSREAIGVLADFCASQNVRFKRKLWLAYVDGDCGPGGGNVK